VFPELKFEKTKSLIVTDDLQGKPEGVTAEDKSATQKSTTEALMDVECDERRVNRKRMKIILVLDRRVNVLVLVCA
jgi:hypothetical protein